VAPGLLAGDAMQVSGWTKRTDTSAAEGTYRRPAAQVGGRCGVRANHSGNNVYFPTFLLLHQS
jgi:hypothetical protein